MKQVRKKNRREIKKRLKVTIVVIKVIGCRNTEVEFFMDQWLRSFVLSGERVGV